jgi:hypothetical protein
MTQPRSCSKCGSSTTLMRGHYARWYKDGSGGWLCAKDYGKLYNKKHPDVGLKWQSKNREYVNAYQREYRAARAAKRKQQ